MTVKERAEKVLAAVIERYEGYWGEQAVKDGFDMPKPKVVEQDDNTLVMWEEGPYEWALRIHGGFNEEMFNNIYPEFVQDRAKAIDMATEKGIEIPDGIEVEAHTTYALCVY